MILVDVNCVSCEEVISFWFW